MIPHGPPLVLRQHPISSQLSWSSALLEHIRKLSDRNMDDWSRTESSVCIWRWENMSNEEEIVMDDKQNFARVLRKSNYVLNLNLTEPWQPEGVGSNCFVESLAADSYNHLSLRMWNLKWTFFRFMLSYVLSYIWSPVAVTSWRTTEEGSWRTGLNTTWMTLENSEHFSLDLPWNVHYFQVSLWFWLSPAAHMIQLLLWFSDWGPLVAGTLWFPLMRRHSLLSATFPSLSSHHILNFQRVGVRLLTGAVFPSTVFGRFQHSPATVSNLGAKLIWRAELSLRW